MNGVKCPGTGKNMTGTVHGLSWFPQIPDNFVTWGSEVNLYKVEKNDTTDHKIKLSGDTSASLLASESRFQFIRCLQPSHQKKVLVAVGLANGKVGLCNFDSNNECIEFTPKQQRTCLSLAWNELEPNLLAMGHDRIKSEPCITIWDVDRGVPKEPTKPIGLSDTAHSLCWDKFNQVLAAGISQKYIKMFDLRQSTISGSISTRMVHGLTISPGGRYLASYVDTVVGLWDLRNLEKQLTQIQTLKNISNLTWCSTRISLLSAVQIDSPFINVIDVHCADIDDSCDIYSTKKLLAPFHTRSVTTSKIFTVTDISWHPTDLERALILSNTGKISEFKVPLRIAIAWDTSNNLWRSIGREMRCTADLSVYGKQTFADVSGDDIGEVMHRRAVNNYGLLPDVKKNGDLAQNLKLKSVWALLGYMTKDERMSGLKKVLEVNNVCDGAPMSRSDVQTIQWPEYVNSSYNLMAYRSEQREHARCLCGWPSDNDSDAFNKFISELCKKKEFSKAAMICTFNLKIKQAIDILSEAAEQSNDASTYKIAAIALSGFNAERCSAVWRNQRQSPHMQISDAYLRAIFAFLTVENDKFEPVMSEKGVSLGDKMAFACKYLSDIRLAEYVNNTIQSCIETGDLHGLLLTGESNDGINLLQSYLDWTEDVQTVALIAIRFFYHNVFFEYQFKYWIESYRNLLDIWGLWEKRAELDIKMENIRSSPKMSRSVFLHCNFCGKSVSTALQEDVRMRNVSTNTNKLSSCPSCRKPLPRCSLCLLHMGTTTGLLSQNVPGHESLGWQSKPFSKWFSWCQTCRHGGHTEHLMQWFSTNYECPVTACSCRCFSLDLSVPKFPRDTP